MLIKLCKNQKGQGIIIWAFLIPVLIGLLGLAIDLGLVVSKKQKIQDAADLAALSGAQYLPLNLLNASNAAKDIFTKSYEKTPKSSTINFFSTGNGIKVQFEDTISLFFMPLLGIDSFTIVGKAEALISPIYKPNNIIPLAIFHTTPLTYGLEVTLWGDLETPIAGNFGLVDPTTDRSMQNKDMETWISNDYKGERGSVLPGSTLLTKPGLTSGPVVKAFNERILVGKSEVICPVVDMSKVNGKGEVPLLGYAKFNSLSAEEFGVGSKQYIKIVGTFVESIDPNGMGDPKAQYFGIKSISLIK
jgi:hypothetical protein